MSRESDYLRDVKRKAETTVEVPHIVWKQTPLTSTNWNGDAKNAANNGVIDLSTEFGVPANIQAVCVRYSVQDETPNVACKLGTSAGVIAAGAAVIARTQAANSYHDVCGWIPCDSNGDIYASFDDEIDNAYLLILAYVQ